MSGLFDLPVTEKTKVEWDVDIPIEGRKFNIGLIVGPSGCGKSTVAKELFGANIIHSYEWPTDKSVIDAFPASMPTKEVVETLSSVGFNSPPSWMRPFHVLSNGEQFRVTCARALAENSDLVVLDEFTSVIDRQVAQVASHSIQKSIRRADKQFIAISCHFDIIDWLQPDWIYEPATGRFQWRELQRHPDIKLNIREADRSLWPIFRHHHYLSGDIHPAAKCFAAYIEGRPVAFAAVLHFPHPKTRNIKMGHRLVVLPDFQGLGIGGRLDDFLGNHLHSLGFRYRNCVAHPAMIAYYAKSPRWRLTNKVNLLGKANVKSGQKAAPSLAKQQARLRRLNIVSFEFCPPARKPIAAAQ
jgi:energy-coupling factor transporter ATP-binding protein EcfA2/GNAT superfamily N-acetyltransferase